MEADIIKVHCALDVLVSFVEKYTKLGDAHMVDYFSKDHWNSLLNHELREDLLNLSIQQLYLLPASSKLETYQNITMKCKDITELIRFKEEANQCHLEAFDLLTDPSEISAFFNSMTSNVEENISFTERIGSEEYMCRKKSHEVSAMSPLIYDLCQACETTEVLDIGSGKGYLSAYLSLRYGLVVTGIEANESNCSSAHTRNSKFCNYWSKHLHNKQLANNTSHITDSDIVTGSFKSVASYINCDSDLRKVNANKCVIVGLHACGDLSSNIVSIFANQPTIFGLCVVGCCYHHNSEVNEQNEHIKSAGFPMSQFLKQRSFQLGRNKRMLGLKAPERLKIQDSDVAWSNSERSLFYRAILTIILKEEFHLNVDRDDIQVGKVFSKSKNFIDYVRRSIKKLELEDGTLKDEKISVYLEQYEPRFKELIAFSIIRQIYAPAIESLIVLDKYCYLLENASKSKISKCFVSEIFDPIVSPRRYAIIAIK